MACQKVIEIKLPDQEETPVVEAHLTPGWPCVVQLSSTVDLFDPQFPELYEQAQIVLSNDLQQRETLTHQGRGLYKGRFLVGEANRTYELSVTLKGKTYKAQSVLPPTVPIHQLSVQTDTTFLPTAFYVNNNVYIYYNDPDTLGNLYYLKVTRKQFSGGSKTRNFLLDDQENNGDYVDFAVVYDNLNYGDTIQAELRHIDRAVFDYLSSLEDALFFNGYTTAAPANPNSNFSNGALGYFGAWGSFKQRFVIN
jgi:hypothetical protein